MSRFTEYMDVHQGLLQVVGTAEVELLRGGPVRSTGPLLRTLEEASSAVTQAEIR